MINKQELRLNNWVIYDSRYFQINCISWSLPFLNTEEFGAGVVEYHNIQPIPLTEDILLKCGFEKQLSLISNKCLVLGKIKAGFYSEGFEIYYGINQILHIKYLHQLQNLVHSLTGEELKIEL